MTTWTGRRLKNARARRDWTQKELADNLGASLRSVAAWERDEARPQAHWVVRLDDLFADVAPPDDMAEDTAQIRRRLTEILAEALTLVTQLEGQPRTGSAVRWAARARDPEAAPERVQFMSADAPSANRAADADQGGEGRAQ